MLYVLESPSGPANCKEYFYSGVIEIKDHIALVESEGAKTYLFHLGFRYLGDIEETGDLATFLKTRDPDALPGDQNDVNYKRETVPPETVPPETVPPETVEVKTIELDDTRPHTVTLETVTPETVTPETVTPETDLPETDLPATGELLERWWDK